MVHRATELKFQHNSLNLVRLLAALQVFYGHATEHLELTRAPIMNYLFPIFYGVPIFFILSGYLVWSSIDRTPDAKTYIKKRALRLYPELWIGIFVSLLSILILYDNVVWKDIVLFTVTQATFMQFWTPNSLRGFGCGTPNGSLWTICTIVQFYIVAWIIRNFLKKKSVYRWLLVLFLATITNVITPYLEGVFPSSTLYKLFCQTLLPYFWLFLIGAFMCEFFYQIMPKLSKFWWIGIILMVIVVRFGLDVKGTYNILQSSLAGITWIGFAYAFPNISIKHDISYGLYIFHMIVINVAVELGYVGNWAVFWVALGISVTMAFLSYTVIGTWGRRKILRLHS